MRKWPWRLLCGNALAARPVSSLGRKGGIEQALLGPIHHVRLDRICHPCPGHPGGNVPLPNTLTHQFNMLLDIFFEAVQTDDVVFVILHYAQWRVVRQVGKENVETLALPHGQQVGTQGQLADLVL
jgi:hypothetical protein